MNQVWPGTRSILQSAPRGARHRSVAGALVYALVGAAVLTLGPLAAFPAGAQVVEPDRAYDIPAGPLTPALNRFGREGNVLLSFSTEQTEDKRTRGINGRYTPPAALDALLEGTELQAVRLDNGGYVLRAAPLASAATSEGEIKTLGRVYVTGDLPDDGTTEGTGSYTTAATSSSTGLDLSLRETPQSITVITHDRMRDQGLEEIAEVMEQVVGIEANRITALGSDGVYYYARGFQVQNYMIDGLARPKGVYGFAEETADMVAYDRVEVVRGASGLTTGMGVPSATINLIRKRPTDEWRGSLTAEAGSWDNYRVEADLGGTLSERGQVRGRLAGSWQDTDTFIDREHIKRHAVYGIVDTRLTPTTAVALGLEYQDFENTGASRGGVPLYFSDGSKTHFARSTNTGADWSDFSKRSTNVFVSLEQNIGERWLARLNAEHKDATYDEVIGYLYLPTFPDPSTGAGGSLYAARWGGDLQLDTVTLNAQGSFEWRGRSQELGFTAIHGRYEQDSPGYPGWWSGSDYARPTSIFALYSSGEALKPDLAATNSHSGREIEETSFSGVARIRPADIVAVLVGGRLSNWKETRWSSSGGARTRTPGVHESGIFTPFAGVTVDVTDNISAYASYTSVFEPQTLVDIQGNRLDPLEGSNREIGLKGEYLEGRLNLSLALFRMKQDNFGVAVGPGIYAPDGSIAYRAESGAKSSGVELEIGGEVLPGWQLAGGFARAKTEDRDGKTLLPYIPQNAMKLFTTYQFEGPLAGLKLGGNLRWQDAVVAQETGPNGQSYRQDALVLIDLTAAYALREHIDIGLHANNLFDKRYYGGLYHTRNSRFGAPRELSLSIKYRF